MVAQTVKNLPARQETQVQSLGLKNPLEKEMATHSSILAWEIPWTEESGGYSPWDLKESDMTEQLTDLFHFHSHHYSLLDSRGNLDGSMIYTEDLKYLTANSLAV